MGHLVIDGRLFNLAVRVENRPRHAAIARNANMFVMYLQVAEISGGVLYEVAVPVTSGGKGNLTVGKRGVFVDTGGQERDAEVVEIIENPISVREAVVSPFRNLARLLTGKVEALTAKAQKDLESVASNDLNAIGSSSQAGATTPAAGAGSAAGKPVGAPGSAAVHAGTAGAASPGLLQRGGLSPTGSLLLGGGVAIAALGSALAYVINTIASLRWWQVLIGLGSALLAVILPAALLAFVKLHRRDLSAIIEASGWAVNARMRLTRRLSRFFTRKPPYLPGSKGLPLRTKRGCRIALPAAIVVLVAAVLYLVFEP